MMPSDRNSMPMPQPFVPRIAPRSSWSEAPPITSTSFCAFMLKSPSATLCVRSSPIRRAGLISGVHQTALDSPGSPDMPLSQSANHDCPHSENTFRTSSHIIVVFHSATNISASWRSMPSNMTSGTSSIDPASNAAPMGLNSMDYAIPGAGTPGWLDVASSRLSMAG